MAKTNQIKKLVNGEIADADDVNQIVENAGAEGGSIPYSDANQQRATLGDENLGSANYPWGDIFVNKEAYLRELITSSASISASVKFDNLRKIIYMKDIFPTTTNSWAGHGGQFLKVRSTEDGIEPSAPTDSVFFSANGTFDVPLGITKVYLTMIGGGGGGGGGVASGAGGGSGAFKINHPFTVTPGGSYTVTVGSGGNGGSSGNPGSNGGTSSFDSVSVQGGIGGAANGGDGGLGGGSSNGLGFDASASVSTAETDGGGQTFRGGNGAKGNESASGAGGGGGGSPFGAGATGPAASNNGNNATANTGAGGSGSGNGSFSGGNGGSGFVLVMY